MLKIHRTPGPEYCVNAGKKHINERLINLLETIMKEYVRQVEPSYAIGIETESDWEKPADTILDIQRLSTDEAFVTEHLDLMDLKPKCVSNDQVLYYFFSLYRLLKSKNEYEPIIVMEYILLGAIRFAITSCANGGRPELLVKLIPESDRERMVTEMKKEVEKLKTISPSVYTGSVDEIVTEFMRYYEDMNMYPMICFRSSICEILDLLPDISLLSQFQTAEKNEFTEEWNMVETEGDGKHNLYRANPWDLEEE